MEVVELSTVDSIRRPVAAASESELETGPAAVELSGLVAASEDHTLSGAGRTGVASQFHID